MTWGNPWAWLGLLALAVPILVHLLARRRSRRMPFPTLRFLEATPPAAVRRSTLSDPLLMALRMLVLAAAVAALAQPYLPTADRTERALRTSNVAVVVDTSWSMGRLTPEGERAADVARRVAEEAAADASTHVVIETAAPGEALAGAAAWLEGRAGHREIRMISDFQRGAVDSVHLAGVPADVGLELRRIPVEGPPPPRVVPHGRTETHVRAAAGPEGTEAVWERRDAIVGDPDADSPLRLLHAPADSAGAAALRLALDGEAVPALDPARPVTVLFPGFEGEAELLSTARAASHAWMGDLIRHLGGDEALARAGDPQRRAPSGATAATPARGPQDPSPDPFVPVVTDHEGRPLVLAAALEHDGQPRLLLVAGFAPGTLGSASLLAAVGRASDPSPPWHELETERLSDDELERWSRAGAPRAPSPGDGAGSDGRWVWILVLALLLGEGAFRKGMRPQEARREG